MTDKTTVMNNYYHKFKEKIFLLNKRLNLCYFFLLTESLAQELEMERKARQQSVEQDIKTTVQDRPNYYKNSVLFSSAT